MNINSPQASAANPEVSQALERLWAKFLPEIGERVRILEEAAEAFTAGNLAEPLREEAHAAAHKLAGTLGMFGLPDGTELARRCELLLADDAPAHDFSAWVCELRRTIDRDR